jgi:LPS sulfotransferase NodH
MTAPATIPLRRAAQRTKPSATGLGLELRKLRNHWRLLRHWWLRPHTLYRPLFVLATHRSGSNLLVDYLNGLRGVKCHSEVLCATLPFAPVGRRYSPQRALRHVRMSLQTLKAPIRGCKLMLDQLHNSRLTAPDLAAAFPDCRFLVLYRQSLAEQFLSLKTATATNQWVLLPGQEARQARVRIERDELRGYCDQVRNAYRRLLESPGLAERSVLLSYEELTADPRHWLEEQISPHIGAPGGQVDTALRKQNTRPLWERIENYREVEALLLSPHCQQSYAWPGRNSIRRRAA